MPVGHRKVRPHLVGIICGLGAVAAMLPSIFPAGASVSAGTVTRVVGTGEQGFAGDGGPATLAELYQPRVLAFDQAGNMYITDTFNQVIRKVDTAGNISTFAGVPAPVSASSDELCPSRYGGDGGPATAAKLACPHGVAVSPDGLVAIADPPNARIRAVDGDGIIRTIAGTGSSGFSGDGGPAASARVSGPKGVAYGPDGNLYIADTNNNRVRKVDATGTITTIVGTGTSGGAGDGGPAKSAQLYQPRTLALDPFGNLYITEPKVNRIRKVDPSGTITLFAGTGTAGFGGDGGPATAARFDVPRGIAVDAAGIVYVADSGNNRIRRIDRDGVVTTIAGTGKALSTGDGGPALSANFHGPRGVVVVGDDLYVSDTYGHSMRKIWGIITMPGGSTTTTTAGGSTTTRPPSTTSTSTTSTSTTSTSTTTTTAPTTSSTTTTTTTVPDPVPVPTTTTTRPVPPVNTASLPSPPQARRPAGYWMLDSGGRVYPFGDALFHGSVAAGPAVSATDIEPTPSGKGYWILSSDGTVLPKGDAVGLGSLAASVLLPGEQAASLSTTPSGRGYWIFTNRGRAVRFGDATFLGDVSALALNGPVLDSIVTPSGRGYFMVAADGGIFSFGDATFRGSMGGKRLNAPVRSLVPTGDGTGYWLVASDGGVFAFGNAPFRGSMGGTALNRPVTGMVRYGDGYLMVAADGGIFTFSDRPFAGSLGAQPPDRPVVSVAALPGV